MSSSKVVVTGLGVLSACGLGWQPFWKACMNQESALKLVAGLGVGESGQIYGGKVEGFKPRDWIENRKSVKLMSRDIQFVVAASKMALDDGNLNLEEEDKTRIGVIVGSGVINNDLSEMTDGIGEGFEKGSAEDFSMKSFGEKGVKSLYPLWMLKYLPNMPASHVSIAFHLQGPSNTVTTFSSSGAQSIGEAYYLIERGDADVMLAGGVDSELNPMGMSRLHGMEWISKDEERADAFSPFKNSEQGFFVGEGAGMLMLESEKHAQQRGAKIYGELVGYGSCSSFSPAGETDKESIRLSMARALEDAEISPDKIQNIILNGSGLNKQDEAELEAVYEMFESNPKSAFLKTVTGHTLYASGGIESAAAVLSLSESNDHEYVLLNSLGLGGQSASLVFKRFEL